MLLKFSAKNYKAFRDGFELSMRPAAIQDLKESILVNEVNDKKIVKGLSSSIIYGPNASGKTSVIKAIKDFQNIISNGGFKENDNKENYDNTMLSLVPFIYDSESKPIEFEIVFFNDEDKKIYKYGLKFMSGFFAELDRNKEIIEEYLYIDNKEVFLRTNNTINIFIKRIKKTDINIGFDNDNFENYFKMINNNIEKNKLFLFSDFSSFISKSLSKRIIDWILNKLFIFINFNDLRYSMYRDSEKITNMPKELYDAVNKIGVIGNEMYYKKSEQNDDDIVLLSRFVTGRKKEVSIPSRLIESFGTLRFIDLFPAVLIALKEGSALIIDELDDSLHPMVIRSIVNIFHDPDINKKKAQLIFNTHNPIYLNMGCFRRDEICFVEKSRESNVSELYKLSDFKTNSDSPTRNTTDYINGYFKNKYGAIEYVDLSEVCSEILKNM